MEEARTLMGSNGSSWSYVKYEQKEYPESVYRRNQKRNGADTPGSIEGDREWPVNNRTKDGNQTVAASGLGNRKDDR